MKINNNGLNLLKESEGLKLDAYLDAVGIPTIGYGHTKGVKLGDRITEEQALALLKEDLAWAEEAVSANVKVNLNENQFSALVSLVYNIGNAAFKDSTLLQLLNKGDFKGASEQFLRWNKANGKVLLGLSTRRGKEKVLFETKSEVVATSSTRDYWLLVSPANDPSKARKLSTQEASILTDVLPDIAKNIGIQCSIDSSNKKIYFGKGASEPAFVSKEVKPNNKIQLRPGDLHLVCSAKNKSAQMYDSSGKKMFQISCLMEGVNGDWTVQNGDTPAGVWKLTKVEEINPPERPYGYYFIWLQPISGDCASVARAGIGIHGGGSASPSPYADDQGLYETHGCIRVKNGDLRDILVPQVKKALNGGRIVWLTTTRD